MQVRAPRCCSESALGLPTNYSISERKSILRGGKAHHETLANLRAIIATLRLLGLKRCRTHTHRTIIAKNLRRKTLLRTPEALFSPRPSVLIGGCVWVSSRGGCGLMVSRPKLLGLRLKVAAQQPASQIKVTT
jgi:hypothetical protein